MKKTTKFLLVLAAVVAMTIGAISTVMAADVVIDSATWSEDDDGNWSAKNTAGVKINNGWAVDEAGHWYYFEEGLALANEFVKWRGNYYYFGKDCIMAEGWVEFTVKNDEPIIDTADVDFTILDDDKTNAYGKSVWCYFEKGGIAAQDKWVETDGLWYYMTDLIMVCNDFDFVIENKTYGFSGNGNMHVGWIPVNTSKDSGKGPTAATKSGSVGYVYYKSNGQMVDLGWEKIGNNWYYFVANEAGSKFMGDTVLCKVEEGTPVMLANTYIDIDGEKFWLTSTGAMATGTVSIAKDYKYFKDVNAFMSGTETKAKATTLQFGSNGAQKLGGKVTEANYYLAEGDTSIYVIDNADNYNKNSNVVNFTKNLVIANNSDVVTDSGISVKLAGDMVKNAFRVSGGKVYYYDANGNMVKNDVVDFYGVTVGFNSKGEMITTNSDDRTKVNGTYFYFNEEFGYINVSDAYVGYGCSTKKPADAE